MEKRKLTPQSINHNRRIAIARSLKRKHGVGASFDSEGAAQEAWMAEIAKETAKPNAFPTEGSRIGFNRVVIRNMLYRHLRRKKSVRITGERDFPPQGNGDSHSGVLQNTPDGESPVAIENTELLDFMKDHASPEFWKLLNVRLADPENPTPWSDVAELTNSTVDNCRQMYKRGREKLITAIQKYAKDSGQDVEDFIGIFPTE